MISLQCLWFIFYIFFMKKLSFLLASILICSQIGTSLVAAAPFSLPMPTMPAPAMPAAPSYTVDAAFPSNIIQTNQVGQAEVKASVTLQLGATAGNLPFDSQVTCVNADPSPSPSVYIEYSVIVGGYFLIFTNCANIASK